MSNKNTSELNGIVEFEELMASHICSDYSKKINDELYACQVCGALLSKEAIELSSLITKQRKQNTKIIFVKPQTAGKSEWMLMIAKAMAARNYDNAELITGKSRKPTLRDFNPKLYDKLKAEGKIIEVDER